MCQLDHPDQPVSRPGTEFMFLVLGRGLSDIMTIVSDPTLPMTDYYVGITAFSPERPLCSLVGLGTSLKNSMLFAWLVPRSKICSSGSSVR